jgi:hypothetical protein
MPSYSWASTRGGMVLNAIWRRFPIKANLMIKPTIVSAVGTAFDMPLPFEAWRASRYHTLEMKGDLREGTIKRVRTAMDEYHFILQLSPIGRYSDFEVHKFFPDCASDFARDEELDISVLLIWHFHANGRALDLKHHLDVRLVLKSVANDEWISNDNASTMSLEDASDERTMRRLGLLKQPMIRTRKGTML